MLFRTQIDSKEKDLTSFARSTIIFVFQIPSFSLVLINGREQSIPAINKFSSIRVCKSCCTSLLLWNIFNCKYFAVGLNGYGVCRRDDEELMVDEMVFFSHGILVVLHHYCFTSSLLSLYRFDVVETAGHKGQRDDPEECVEEDYQRLQELMNPGVFW